VTQIPPDDTVRQDLALGKAVDEIAAHLIAEGVHPIPTIKALLSGTGISLREAKTYVDHSLSVDVQKANERLRDLAEAVLSAAQTIDEARCTGVPPAVRPTLELSSSI